MTADEITITDDDATPTVTLALSKSSIPENGGSTTVTATLSGVSSAATTVTVSAAAVSPAVSGDFTLSQNKTLTIAAGQTASAGTVTIAAVNNTVDAPNKQVTVSGDASGGHGAADPANKTLTITDDEGTPTLTLKLSKSTISESGGVTTVTAELSAASSAATTVTVSAAAVSPATSSDFTLSTGKTLTIAAGATASTGTVTISAVDNTTDAADKQVTVSGAASGGRGVADPTDQTLTIADDDGAIALSAAPASVAESAGSTEVTVTARLPGAARSAATTVTVKVGDSGDAATEGTDYATVDDFILTIASGATSGTAKFNIDPTQDAIDEGTGETLSISGTTDASGLSVSATQMTIADDDATPTVTLALSKSSIPENGGSTTVTATLSGVSSAATTVTVSAAAVSPAVSGDFTLSQNKTLTIAAGSTASTGTVTISAVNNTVDAPNKTVTVSGDASGGHGAADPANQTLTITDDEGTPTLTLKLSKGTISESGGVTTVTAELSAASSAATTVTVSAAAVSPAVSGDFTLSQNKTLTIAAGATASTGTVTISAVDNTTDAADKQVTVSGAASGGRGVADPTGGFDQTLTIADDDGAIALSVAPASVAESAGSTEVTVTARLPGAARSAATTVTVKVGDSGDAATEGTDYATVDDFTLTIASGATSGSAKFDIDPTQDAIDEGSGETLSISGTTDASGLSVSATQMTITDDDATPTVTLALSKSSIPENGGSTTVTATLSGVSSAATTVTVSAAAVSPAVSGDFTLSENKTLTIAAGQTASTGTVTITAVNNTVDAPNKQVTVSGDASGGHGAADPANKTLTITDDDAAPSGITLAASPDTVTENGGAKTVTVTASVNGTTRYAAAKTVAVTVGKSADSATEGTDYSTVGSLSISIAAGAASGSKEFTLTPTNDDLDEANETISVEGASAGVTVTADEITITDDDAAPSGITLVASPDSVTENGGAKTVTVTASVNGTTRYAAAKTVAVTVGKSADSATEGTDYSTVGSLSISIAAGAASGSKSFTLTPTDDAIDEANETISVEGTSAGVTVTADEITITDDDATPTVTLALSKSSIPENGGSTTVTATLSGVSSAATTVTVSAAAVSPAVSGDFTLSQNKTLTIAAGQTASAGTVTITAVNNTVDAPNKQVTVSGDASGGHGAADPANKTLTITDDEGTPTLTLKLSKSTISESGGVTTVTAELSAASSAATTVTVSAAAVSPATSSDFTLSTGKTLTIAAGATASTGTVTISAVDNTTDAADKQVTVSGAASGGRGVADPTDQTLTIADDDGAIALSAAPASVAESAGSTEVTVTARLPGAARSAATTVTVKVGDSGDAATEGTDYATVDDFILTIASGATSGTAKFNIDPTQDAIDEGTGETLSISGTTDASGLSVSATQMTIADDDATPTVTLALSKSSIPENGGSTTVTATLSGVSSAATTVTVSAAAVSPAVSGDFTLSQNKTLTIAAGSTASTGTVTISAVNNTVDAPNKTVTVSGDASGGHGAADPANQTLTITDDEGTPTLTLKLSKGTISESGGVTTVTAELSAASSAATTVTVSAAAVSPAVSGDFTVSTNKTLTIAAGATASTGTVTISAVDNTTDAADKQVTVSGAASGGRGVADPTDQTLTIADDDGAIALSAEPASVAESAGATEVTVTARLPGAARSAATTVTVKVGDSGDAATEGTDYATVDDFILTIASGATSGTAKFDIDPTQDAIDEGTGETLSISGTTDASGLSVSATQMTITDDDATPTVTLALSKSSIPENGGSTTVTATLSGVSSAATTVTVSAAAVSPAVSGDYTLSQNKTLTIAAGQTASTGTVTITAVNNTVDAPNKTVTVSGDASGGHGAADPANKTLTITDDDAAPSGITLAASPDSVTENGGAKTVTVTASVNGTTRYAAAKTVTVKVGKSADSATEGTDYTTVADLSISIAAGAASASKSFTLTPTNDDLDEANETISVEGASAGVTVTADEITITDDDAAPSGITLVASPDTVTENGGAKTVTVTASVNGTTRYAAAKTVAVTVGKSADNATEGTDYSTVGSLSISIAAGAASGSKSFTLTPTNDAIDEANETISVEGTSAGVTVTADEITITDDDATPTVTLALSKSSIPENGGSTTVTATLSGASSAATTVTVSAAAVSPAVSGDFTLSQNKTLTIAAGQTASSGTVTITAVNNTVDAPNKTVTVSGDASGGHGAADPANQTLTITDDDAAPSGITLAASPDTVTENGGAKTVTVTATVNGATRYAAAKTVTVKVGKSADSATKGTDYATVADLSISIAAGAASATRNFTLTPTNDDLDEANETISVEGASAGGDGDCGPDHHHRRRHQGHRAVEECGDGDRGQRQHQHRRLHGQAGDAADCGGDGGGVLRRHRCGDGEPVRAEFLDVQLEPGADGDGDRGGRRHRQQAGPQPEHCPCGQRRRLCVGEQEPAGDGDRRRGHADGDAGSDADFDLRERRHEHGDRDAVGRFECGRHRNGIGRGGEPGGERGLHSIEQQDADDCGGRHRQQRHGDHQCGEQQR